MPPFFFLFLYYYIDQLAVKYLLLNILSSMSGHNFPQNSQIIAKIIMNIKNCCNNVAIIWGNNTPIPEDWNNNRDNFLQFAKIGVKLIKIISSNLRRLG